jgi:hypothetical protein
VQDQSSSEAGSSASATGGSDFADQGRGALDQQSNPTGQANRDESDSEGQDDSGSF